MVEVFKTNIEDAHRAKWLINRIHETFYEYEANFDLDDCDNILRVKCKRGVVDAEQLVFLLAKFNCNAEVLKDEIQYDFEPEKFLKERLIISK